VIGPWMIPAVLRLMQHMIQLLLSFEVVYFVGCRYAFVGRFCLFFVVSLLFAFLFSVGVRYSMGIGRPWCWRCR